jgi:arginine exporter protein ArgO
VWRSCGAGPATGLALIAAIGAQNAVVLRCGGAACPAWWAVRSFASAARPPSLSAEVPRSRGSVITTALARTCLTPHVCLDTRVLLGGLAQQHGADARWVVGNATACSGPPRVTRCEKPGPAGSTGPGPGRNLPVWEPKGGDGI